MSNLSVKPAVKLWVKTAVQLFQTLLKQNNQNKTHCMTLASLMTSDPRLALIPDPWIFVLQLELSAAGHETQLSCRVGGCSISWKQQLVFKVPLPQTFSPAADWWFVPLFGAKGGGVFPQVHAQANVLHKIIIQTLRQTNKPCMTQCQPPADS